MAPRIGISLGDITGIGPEVTLKALALELPAACASYTHIGDESHLRLLDRQLGLRLPFDPGVPGAGPARLTIRNPLELPLPVVLESGAPAAARAAVAWLEDGARACLRGELDALVTAPVNKPP